MKFLLNMGMAASVIITFVMMGLTLGGVVFYVTTGGNPLIAALGFILCASFSMAFGKMLFDWFFDVLGGE